MRDDKGEYYREPGLTRRRGASLLLLDDTMLPDRPDARGGARSLPRAEGLDAAPGGLRARSARDEAAATPTPSPSRTSRSALCSPEEANRHAVFFTHPRESISYHYERNPADPRISTR